MMTIHREYLHIDEADSIEGLSKFVLIEMFQKKEVELYCWLEPVKLFAQALFKGNEKPSIIGSFSYSGIVKIPYQQTLDLIIQQKPVTASHFLIIESDKVSKWSNNEPKDVDYPNKKYLEYRFINTPPDFSFWSFIDATSTTKTKSSKSLGSSFNNLMRLMDDRSDEEKERMLKAANDLKNVFNGSLTFEDKTFYPVDLRFKKSDFIQENTKSSDTIKISNTRAPSNLDQLIILLLERADLNSGQIWIALQKESKKEILDRKIDEYGIIEEVSHEYIFWRTQTGVIKQIKRSGFRKKVSTIRTKYFSS